MQLLISLALCIFMSANDVNPAGHAHSAAAHLSDPWKTLKHDQYSIQYPADWDLDQSGQMGSSFLLFSPLTSDQDQFRENVNLMIQDLSEYPMTLDAYTEFSLEQIKALGYEMIEDERVKDNSSEYHKLAYSGPEGDFTLVYVQQYWVIGTNAFLLTFTGELDHYADYKDTADKILRSFKHRK